MAEGWEDQNNHGCNKVPQFDGIPQAVIGHTMQPKNHGSMPRNTSRLASDGRGLIGLGPRRVGAGLKAEFTRGQCGWLFFDARVCFFFFILMRPSFANAGLKALLDVLNLRGGRGCDSHSLLCHLFGLDLPF